ncbi:MAG: hypothetical protein QF903_04240 [Planctomycetota bacterium]|jgi:hypothetical protein|nr:hypothetical protein [Planctomycetota bacterium]
MTCAKVASILKVGAVFVTLLGVAGFGLSLLQRWWMREAVTSLIGSTGDPVPPHMAAVSNFGLLGSLWIAALGLALFVAAPWLAAKIGKDDLNDRKTLQDE